AQLFDRLSAGRRVEISINALGQDRTDAFDLGESLRRGVAQRIDRAKLLGEYLRNVFADVANSQPGQNTAQAAALTSVDSGQEILSRFFAHPFELDQRLQRQSIDIGN